MRDPDWVSSMVYVTLTGPVGQSRQARGASRQYSEAK